MQLPLISGLRSLSFLAAGNASTGGRSSGEKPALALPELASISAAPPSSERDLFDVYLFFEQKSFALPYANAKVYERD